MLEHPATERDLRAALESLAPADLDATAFRARLDRLLEETEPTPVIAAAPATATNPTDDSSLTLIPDRPRRPRRSRIALVVTMAACVAAVLAIAVALLPTGREHRQTPRPAGTTAPAAIRPMLLPGTMILRTYTGHGSQSFPVAPRAIPARYQYEAYGTCRGTGDLTITQQTLIRVCQNGGAAFGTSDVVGNGRLTVTADPGTTWQITLTLSPQTLTNGSVQGPVDADMAGADTAVRQSGRGSAVAHFGGAQTQPASDGTYEVRLVCRGSGVRMPGLTASRAAGLDTRTCFSGREYVWQGVHLNLPAAVRVQASAGTTWTIVID